MMDWRIGDELADLGIGLGMDWSLIDIDGLVLDWHQIGTGSAPD
jgi:hypothetical protein